MSTYFRKGNKLKDKDFFNVYLEHFEKEYIEKNKTGKVSVKEQAQFFGEVFADLLQHTDKEAFALYEHFEEAYYAKFSNYDKVDMSKKNEMKMMNGKKVSKAFVKIVNNIPRDVLSGAIDKFSDGYDLPQSLSVNEVEEDIKILKFIDQVRSKRSIWDFIVDLFTGRSSKDDNNIKYYSRGLLQARIKGGTIQEQNLRALLFDGHDYDRRILLAQDNVRNDPEKYNEIISKPDSIFDSQIVVDLSNEGVEENKENNIIYISRALEKFNELYPQNTNYIEENMKANKQEIVNVCKQYKMTDMEIDGLFNLPKDSDFTEIKTYLRFNLGDYADIKKSNVEPLEVKEAEGYELGNNNEIGKENSKVVEEIVNQFSNSEDVPEDYLGINE